MSATVSEKAAAREEQYSLAKIMGIWLAVALPMAILGWVVLPALSPDYKTDPLGAGAVRMGAITVGLAWEFILALFIVYREEGDLRWATLKRRLRLNKPLDPESGEPRSKLWLWLIPIILLHIVMSMTILTGVDRWIAEVLPVLAPPEGSELSAFLESPETKAELVGAWWLLGLFLFMAFFNIFGEEFLWRGVLLPKMNGAFGKWDWVANGVLGALYHLHMPWSWFGTTGFSWIFFYALPAKYFRSTWMSIISHGSMIVMETVFFLAIISGLM